MHPCLLSIDIFSNILDHVLTLVQEVDPFGSSNMYAPGNPTLASLARTCKAFMEPTLDALWRSQVTLAPLVQTFPEDVWSQKLRRYADTTQEPLFEIVRHRFCLLLYATSPTNTEPVTLRY